ncbi:uncharacterized protein LOC113857242 [Abrus precatorius]|uniref:Uncharacterized protein LOC113857242 n=1 Tax=Abrus precatorius TaxID=3816 RepID=A0A8B8KM09_ABRPR|nr:uncharacterized protein LOC113857242 [Abrus precatorius]
MGSIISKGANGFGSVIGNAFSAPFKTLLFFYLLFKLGICQCIGRSLCKMCWVTCEAWWLALADITCYLWHKLISTKRVYRGRRRFRDVELGIGYSPSDESDRSCNNNSHVGRKRKSLRERRNECSRRGHGHGVHHLARKKGRPWRLRKASNRHGNVQIFKRQRFQ